ncbi:transcription elongation factor B polypeptide 3 [Lucilia cuprina]|uniref:transcription elongation factor B polypeptide 3 n=1 Tax=Lucilia cuprina TaxID=7375 RepID=UPI001F06CC13|nr:transcription elongation factor B polypeptide 3 [Lucilia cuprina]
MTSIVEVIQHYQRSIDSSQDNEARLLHCINKLYKLPIKVEHLQETGVGKTVNSLRKFNGEIGVAAKTLVTKWKAMVAAEEEPMDTTSQTNESETHNGSNGDDGGTTPHDEEDENHNRNNTSQQYEHSKKHHRSEEKKDKHKDRHKDRSSSSSNGHKEHSKQSSSHNSEKSSKNSNENHKSSSSSKEKESHHKSSSSSHKDKEREKEKTDQKSSRDKDKHKERDHDKDKERSDRKREEKSKADKEHKSESPSNTLSSQHKSSSNSSSSKSKHEDKHSQSSSKDKERSDKHKSSSKDKVRTKDEKSSSQTSSSKDKNEHKSSSTPSTSKSSTKDPDSADRKRRHNSDNDSNDFKSPQPKVAKVHKSSSSSSTLASKSETSPPLQTAEEDAVDDSFDSSMGANFDDVLGMLNMPIKKSKKSTKSPSTPASGSSTAKKETTTPHRPTTSSSSSSSSGSAVANKVNGTRIAFTSNSSSSYSTPSTSKASTMKPDLLAPSAKLEPLDPSIALELPTISTNYKPMPLNQTVMDCVFNNSAASSRPVRTLTDAEAITHGISSKTMRTKIYSGVRTGQTFQVPSLFDMCIRILQKNIDALEYTGGVPFEVLKPVLERASPQQLYVFEEYNPYLMEDSDVLWQQHVSRNYRTKKRLENESWREMYIRCQEEDERRLSVLKDSIKASQKIAAAPVRKTQLAFVDSMVKPPRNIQKRQEQFGTKSKMVATPAARVASLSSVTPNAAKTGDQRLRVAPTVRDHAQVSSSIRNKKAPLMQKTLQFIRGRHKR